MDIMTFDKIDCANCYKCLRSCQVKAIAFQQQHARIVQEDCILCGDCIQQCPHPGQHYIKSDMERIRQMLAEGEQVYVSLAPHYLGEFREVPFQKLAGALKRLGFAGVEETAIGAETVAREYSRMVREHRMENIITTHCPSIVRLVEKYYKGLEPCLAPVISPLQAHGRMLKSAHPGCKVVYAGSCIAQNLESEMGTDIDGVMRFSELKSWMAQAGIDLTTVEEAHEPEMQNTYFRSYSIANGMVKAVRWFGDIPYKVSAIDGVDRCMDVLEALSTHEITGCFIEMSACGGGCAGNVATRRGKKTFLSVRDLIMDNTDRREGPAPVTEGMEVPLTRRFYPRVHEPKRPNSKQLQEILAQMGKTDRSRMLNCGSCGYDTCVEKAIAVFQGRAEVTMCVPYMRERAESMSNVILDNSPLCILALDSRLQILSANPAAQRLLAEEGQPLEGRPVEEVLPCGDFRQVQDSGENLLDHTVEYESLGLTMEQSVIYIPRQGIYVVLARDVTREYAQQRELDKAKEEMLSMAQRVVDKQMRVAQEIASLLGESTAETKVTFTRLKRSLLDQQQGR